MTMPHPPSQWRPRVLAAAAAILATSTTAWAAEDEDVDPNKALMAAWPTLRWVAFVDKEPLHGPGACAEEGSRDDRCNCDPIAARYGTCVEEVRFDPLLNAQGQFRRPDPSISTRARSTSDLHHWLWEDLTWQYGDPESPANQLLTPLAATGPLPLGTHWDSSRVAYAADGKPRREVTVALPEANTALPESTWQGSAESLFDVVRHHHPAGAKSPPSTILLSGRFAQRLGSDNRRLRCDGLDCNILDADPEFSGPFYEQMYPVRQERVGDAGRPQPLAEFEFPAGLQEQTTDGEPVKGAWSGKARERVVLEEDSMEALEYGANDRFLEFSRLLSSRIAEYGMIDHTTNQMRVFAALTALRYPPGALESSTGITRDLVAAAIGQTDDEAVAESRVTQDQLAFEGGFEIKYDQLPDTLVKEWLEALLAAGAARDPGAAWPPDAWWADFDRGLERDFEDLRRVGVSRLPKVPRSLELEELDDWVRAHMQEGLNVRAYSQQVQVRALAQLIELVPSGEEAAGSWSRERMETWLLLDHLHQSLASTFDATQGARTTPADLAESAAEQWRGTLARHQVESVPIEQGLNAIDPTAACTTLDGRAALGEPSFGAVNVDLLLAATDGAPDPETVLWERREDVPFLAMDQPIVTRPVLDRLVGLPGDRALYRVRWTVWTGWHLLWDRVPLGDGSARAALRFGVFCDDMVLSPPDEVATIVRAALLQGMMQPSIPVRRSDIDGPDPVEPPSMADPGAVLDLGGAAAAVRRGQEALRDAERARSTAQSSDGSGTLARERMDILAQRAAATDRPMRRVVTPQEARDYFRSFVLPPLRSAGRPGSGTVLTVFDHGAPGPNRGLGEVVSRTPYARVQRHVRGEGRIASAGWSWFIPTDDLPATPLAPAFNPREAEGTELPMPRWRRPRTLDWSLAGNLSHFPLRITTSTCNPKAASASSVEPCVRGAEEIQRTEGFAIDVQAFAVWWLRDRTRLGLEMGIESRVDALHAGPSFYWSDPEADPATSERTEYAWSFRPTGGLVLGLRGAPRPGGLWHRSLPGQDHVRTPWGANRPDDKVRGGRTQWGVRTGMLVGPGFNSMEGTALGELWLSRSFVRREAPRSTVPPYRPLFTIGPFSRAQLGFPLGGGEPRYRELIHSWTFLFGIRSQFRLSSAAPPPPSASVPE